MRYQEILEKQKELQAADLPAQQVMEQVIGAMMAYRREQKERVNALMDFQFLGCDAEAKTLRLGFPVSEWQLNPAGTMHGGMFATAADIAIGMLANYYGQGHYCTTVSMTVNFLRPVQPGDMLIIEGCMEKNGRTLQSLSYRGWCASNGETALTGSGTYMKLDRKLS